MIVLIDILFYKNKETFGSLKNKNILYFLQYISDISNKLPYFNILKNLLDDIANYLIHFKEPLFKYILCYFNFTF